MKKHIPNACTSMNLVFGMISLMYTFSGDLYKASICIFFALAADGMDGRLARHFGVSGELGKEMDSLCDLVSFGVAPAMIAYTFGLGEFGVFGAAVSVFFALCGMWRLARFNVNTDVVHGYFMGLAIPAGACVVASSTLLFMALNLPITDYGYAYPLMIAMTSYLMISRVHYPDFKGKGEKIYPVSLVLSAAVMILTAFFAKAAFLYGLLCGFFFAYALLGLINSLSAIFAKEN